MIEAASPSFPRTTTEVDSSAYCCEFWKVFVMYCYCPLDGSRRTGVRLVRDGLVFEIWNSTTEEREERQRDAIPYQEPLD